MDDAGCKLPDKNGPDKGAPPPEGCAGNPVNITNGNKYQVEHDLITPIPLARHYNGLDGLWRHSFSARITRKDDSYLLYREDGKVSEFTGAGRDLTSLTDLGKLSRLAGRFFYTSELNEIIEFDPYGKLARLTTKEGRKYRVERGASLTISDEHGNKLVLSEGTNHQLLRAQIGGISIEYTYDKEQRLTSVTRTDGQYSTKTQYLYDDPRNIKLLTGIQDNNNRRFATWAYDNQGRAISSEHANGAEKVTLAYNDDGSTTVTNEYGKQATYRFQVIQGIKRIVAIEGEPSPNCPSSNSTFTYDERGLLSSKRDNNGNLTTYQYNVRGLETSRTEAAGTAQARTITTDWHPTLFLPVQVSEPGRITRYQYDAEGRKTGETVTTR
ncbi:TPA: RHS repeat protein [Pseudomonas aeruginosa]|nr:RHS repeat protein [Pseudomonas aeruginosa]